MQQVGKIAGKVSVIPYSSWQTYAVDDLFPLCSAFSFMPLIGFASESGQSERRDCFALWGGAKIGRLSGRTRSFASYVPKGIYRASTKDEEMAATRRPRTDAAAAWTAYSQDRPPSNSSFYYFASKWTASKEPAAKTTLSAFIAAMPPGRKWELLSTGLRSTRRLTCLTKRRVVQPIAVVEEKKGDQTAILWRILMSTDSGKHWQDISHGLEPGFQLYHIFQDPDHKDLVCVGANCLRNYVMYAGDKDYKWQFSREWGWYPKHLPEKSFFADEYFTGTTLFMEHATLENLFFVPFRE